MELAGWPLAITEVVALGEAGLSGILCLLLPTACDIYSCPWPGQTLGTCNRIKDECCRVLPVWCLLPAPMPLGILGSLEPEPRSAVVKSLAFEASQAEVPHRVCPGGQVCTFQAACRAGLGHAPREPPGFAQPVHKTVGDTGRAF